MKLAELHRWDVKASEAARLQKELRGQISPEDAIAPEDVRVVAGADNAYVREATGTVAVAAVVVLRLPGFETLETRVAWRPVTFPYVPGLLSFREAPALIAALGETESEPDVVLFDAQGYAHPRRLGAASHLGLLLDRPSVGCAKSRLVGTHGEPGHDFGARAPLEHRGEVVGAVVRTHPGGPPLYVSPGHKVSVYTAVEIVLRCCDGSTQMPVPTQRAHDVVTAQANARRAELASESPSPPGRGQG